MSALDGKLGRGQPFYDGKPEKVRYCHEFNEKRPCKWGCTCYLLHYIDPNHKKIQRETTPVKSLMRNLSAEKFASPSKMEFASSSMMGFHKLPTMLTSEGYSHNPPRHSSNNSGVSSPTFF